MTHEDAAQSPHVKLKCGDVRSGSVPSRDTGMPSRARGTVRYAGGRACRGVRALTALLAVGRPGSRVHGTRHDRARLRLVTHHPFA
eukprot:5792823-Prymnesium_polylepis.2